MSEPSGYERAVEQSKAMAAEAHKLDRVIRAQEALQLLRAEWVKTGQSAEVVSLCDRRAQRDKTKEQAA